MKTIYSEVQKFRQAWVWLVMSGLFFLSEYAFFQQVVFNIPFGKDPAPDVVLIIIPSILLLMILMLLYSKLVFEIKDDGIYYRYHPFHFKTIKIKKEDIVSAFVRNYKFSEFGGWGIRFSFRGKGRALNVSGKTGLQLVLTNGKKILLGTQKPVELEAVINNWISNN